ncbi:PREDICTED: quinone oxidoreductase-like protein 2 [Habropoda laboriosa]|uniref:quinone oxidoreductase-like protein 2 n=1 Tax=Habropoda laboriosa TaxID=597456 RepID=UPI00083D02F2|nr:PREDICTED: quinone oxidoreductase-like protein 2 [Habropoda laboriosa]
MSASVGRRIFVHLCSNHLKSLPTRTRIVRFYSVAKEKSPKPEDNAINGMPASEPGKISAAVLKKFSDPLILENLELPKILQANEVLVDVQYCALNASDALLSKNLYKFEPTLPMVLGYEFVGKLVQVGEEAEKQGYKVGDKVVALNKERYGGLAEQCIAEVSDIWSVPSGVKSVDAVGIINDYVTALVALERKVSIQEEDMIFINVGISGVGLAAVDLATNVFRAQVISVCASEDGAALAREKGVLASFKFKAGKLLRQIEEVAAEKDIKAIFEGTDGDYFKKMLTCFTDIYKNGEVKELLRDDSFGVMVHHLSREGRVVIAGTTATVKDSDSDAPKESFTVSGFNLTEYRKKKPEVYRQAGEEVLEFIEEGLIKPTCVLTVKLPEVNDALEFILKNQSPGKVIVDIKCR